MRGWLWFWCRLRSIRPSSNLLPEDGDYTSTWYVIFVAFKSFVSTFRAHLIIVLLHCIYRLWWHWTKELRLLYLGWYIAANWQSDKCETSSFIYSFHFFIEACIFRLVSLTRSFCILNCSKVPTSSPSQQPTSLPTQVCLDRCYVAQCICQMYRIQNPFTLLLVSWFRSPQVVPLAYPPIL